MYKTFSRNYQTIFYICIAYINTTNQILFYYMHTSSSTHAYTAMHTFHYLATFYSFLTNVCYSILLHYTIHTSLLCLINTFSSLVYAILDVDMLIQTSLHFVYIYVVAQSSHVCHPHILTSCIYMYVVPHRPHCKQPG